MCVVYCDAFSWRGAKDSLFYLDAFVSLCAVCFGRITLYEFLKSKGILPVLEQQDDELELELDDDIEYDLPEDDDSYDPDCDLSGLYD